VVLPVKNYPELSALGVAELEGLAIGYGGTALGICTSRSRGWCRPASR
jgi:hypothetical protein